MLATALCCVLNLSYDRDRGPKPKGCSFFFFSSLGLVKIKICLQLAVFLLSVSVEAKDSSSLSALGLHLVYHDLGISNILLFIPESLTMRTHMGHLVSKRCHSPPYMMGPGRGTISVSLEDRAPRVINIHLQVQCFHRIANLTHRARAGKIRGVIVHKIMHVYIKHGATGNYSMNMRMELLCL